MLRWWSCLKAQNLADSAHKLSDLYKKTHWKYHAFLPPRANFLKEVKKKLCFHCGRESTFRKSGWYWYGWLSMPVLILITIPSLAVCFYLSVSTVCDAKGGGGGNVYFVTSNLGDIVFGLGRDEGYTVKYSPLPEGVPKGKAQGNSQKANLFSFRVN